LRNILQLLLRIHHLRSFFVSPLVTLGHGGDGMSVQIQFESTIFQCTLSRFT
jgi:hypothetical protein